VHYDEGDGQTVQVVHGVDK